MYVYRVPFERIKMARPLGPAELFYAYVGHGRKYLSTYLYCVHLSGSLCIPYAFSSFIQAFPLVIIDLYISQTVEDF